MCRTGMSLKKWGLGRLRLGTLVWESFTLLVAPLMSRPIARSSLLPRERLTRLTERRATLVWTVITIQNCPRALILLPRTTRG